MIVGCVKEIKKHEYRVGLTPNSVKNFICSGHRVYIETGAGEGSNFPDSEYREAGAEILSDPKSVYSISDMIIKVKEPLEEEFEYLKEGQILFTYLHLAANRDLTLKLLEKRITAIAYETIELEDGSLPCLKPMSEIAGRLSIQEGAKYLESPFGGRGVLLGGIPGVQRGRVTILGGGVVGFNAALMAVGLGADVTILDIDYKRLEYLESYFFSKITTLYSTRENIIESIKSSDLIIGAVLIPGGKAPYLIKREDFKHIKNGTVIVDVSVDQGGCIETTRPTTHDNPVFYVDNVVNYCVANMPGAVAKTATNALIYNTLKYGLLLADLGLDDAFSNSPELLKGLNCYRGKLINNEVAKSHNMDFTTYKKLL